MTDAADSAEPEPECEREPECASAPAPASGPASGPAPAHPAVHDGATIIETHRSTQRSAVQAVDWRRAREIAHAAGAAAALEPHTVPLVDAAGRWAAAAVEAQQPIPHFDSAAMDGWAVSGSGPWRLVVDGRAHDGAGRGGRGEPDRLDHGRAVRINTGHLIPPGTTSVLRSERGVEQTRESGGRIELHLIDGTDDREITPGKHIRRAGEEAAVGEVMIDRHTLLNPAHLALAAGCGVDDISVAATARARLVLTGDEVDERGAPGPGRVRDSFGPSLPALVRMLGASVTTTERIGDHAADTRASLFAASTSMRAGVSAPVSASASAPITAPEHLIITTGGTGGSSADHLRSALDDLGARTIIRRLATRPGGPTTLSRLPDGRFVLSLPGNPLAAMIGLLIVGSPLLAGITGRPLSAPRVVTLEAPLRWEERRGVFVAPYVETPNGARVTAWTGSAMLRGLASADGLAVLGAATTTVADALPLPWR